MNSTTATSVIGSLTGYLLDALLPYYRQTKLDVPVLLTWYAFIPTIVLSIWLQTYLSINQAYLRVAVVRRQLVRAVIVVGALIASFYCGLSYVMFHQLSSSINPE